MMVQISPNTPNPNSVTAKSQSLFQGEVNDNITLIDIFQTLVNKPRKGWLTIKTQEGGISFQVEGKSVGLITAPGFNLQQVPEKLYYASKIAQEDYLAAKKMPEAELLLFLQKIAPEDVSRVVETICYDHICNILSRARGRFEFSQQIAVPQEPIGKIFEIESLLMEASRRQDESPKIYEQLPSLPEIIIHNAKNSIDAKAAARPQEILGNTWRLAQKRTIQNILDYSYFSAFEVAKTLAHLYSNGYIQKIAEDDLILYAQDLESQGQSDEAEACYTLLRSRRPEESAIIELTAKFYERIGKADRAFQLYSQLLQSLPNISEEDKHHRCVFLKKMGDLLPESAEGAECKWQLFQIVAQEKFVPKFDYNPIAEGKSLAQYWQTKGNFTLVKQIFHILTTIASQDLAIRDDYIAFCLEAKDISGAITQYLELANIFGTRGDLKNEEVIYQKILHINPHHLDVKKRLEALRSKKQHQRRILQIVGGITIILVVVAIALMISNMSHQQHEKAANEILSAALQKDWRAVAQAIQGLSPLAKEQLRNQFIQIPVLLEEHIQALLAKAAEADKKGNYAEAQKSLQEALIFSLKPTTTAEIRNKIESVDEIWNDFQSKLGLAQKYEKEGDYTKAIENYLLLWNNIELRKFPQCKELKLPVRWKVIPKGATILVDEQLYAQLSTSPETVWLPPEFHSLMVSFPGYESVRYYNAFLNMSDEVSLNKAGDKIYPIHTAEITLVLKKQYANCFALSERIAGEVCLGDNTIYLASQDGSLYVFSPELQLKWAHKVGKANSLPVGPCYYRGMLYIVGNNTLYAIQTPNQKNDVAQLAAQFNLGFAVTAAPLCVGQHIVCMSNKGDVSVFSQMEGNVKNWQPVWKISLGQPITAVAANNQTLAIATANQIQMLDIKKGQKRGEFTTQFTVQAMAWEENMLYQAGQGIQALDTNTRNVLWQTKIEGSIHQCTLVKDYLYCTSSNRKVYQVSCRDGKTIYQFETIGEIKTAPAISNSGIVYVACQEGYLYASKQGELMWKYKTETENFSSPVVCGNTVIIASNKLFSFLDN